MAESTGSTLTSDDDFWDTKPTDSQTCDNNFGGVSNWCKRDNILQFGRFLRKVREGDRLEFVNSNLPYLHCWAIYKSFSELNHTSGSAVTLFNDAYKELGAYSKRNPSLNVSVQASKNVIVVTCIFSFLLKPGNKVRINNLKDKDWSPLGTRHIRKEVTNEFKYLHTIVGSAEVYLCRNQFKDSEDFVNYCRYDRDHQHNYRRDNNYERISEWYSKTNIEGFIHEVRVGDRLEFRCNSTYERWGIYIGKWGDDLEQVVLFAHGDETNSAKSTERLKPKLWAKSIQKHVVDEYDQIRINNESDRKWPPLDWKSILKEISHQLSGRAGTHYECSVLFKDSEDFVNYCRYDDWRINFGLVSDWGLLPDHRMRVGDRLEFHQTGRMYEHWGIYVGRWGADNNQVVHFAPANGNGKLFSKKKSSGSGSSAKDKPVLCVNSIWIFSGKVRINNERDHIWPPFDRTHILDEIKRQSKSQSDGNQPAYNLFFNNCEHFVNHCRYGKHHSDQVSRITRIRDHVMKGHRRRFQQMKD